MRTPATAVVGRYVFGARSQKRPVRPSRASFGTRRSIANRAVSRLQDADRSAVEHVPLVPRRVRKFGRADFQGNSESAASDISAASWYSGGQQRAIRAGA